MRVKYDSRKGFAGGACMVTLLGVLAFSLGAMLAPRPAQATTPGSFVVSYFDDVANDNAVRIVNPTKSNGSICALIYVFDASEEMGECCGCPITPNGLLSLSVKNSLTNNWATGNSSPGAGVIEVVSTLKTGATCPADDPACNVGGDFTSSPAIACDPTTESAQRAVPNLSAWLTHVETVGSQTANSVEEFADEGSTDSAEGTYLPQECENIISDGSGVGACNCGHHH